MCTAVLIGWDHATPSPSPIWTHIRGRYWSAKTDDICITLLLAYFLHGNKRNDVFVFSNWVIILIIGFANGNHAFAKEAGMLRGGVHCSLIIPSEHPFISRDCTGFSIINNIDTKVKRRHLKNWYIKGLCKLLPFSSSLWFISPPPPLHCVNKYSILSRIHTVCKGVGIWGFGPQTAKHLPRSTFTGHFFKYHQFALPSMSLIFLRISESDIGKNLILQ